ncbi:MAG: DUF935 domain-containing protein [Pseudomonadota bacterium]
METERTTRLLDAQGRPVKVRQLMKPQAEPGLRSVRQTWAPTIAAGLTPQRLSAVLRSADEGEGADYLVLAEEMEERDMHYSSVLGIRKRAVSGVAPVVEAASEDQADEDLAEEVREQIAEHPGFPDMVEDLLDAVGKGYSATEIEWSRSARRWDVGAFIHRDPRWFRWDRETGRELRLLDEADMIDGVSLAPFKWIVHAAGNKSGLPLRGGVARLVAFGWMCKAYALKDWVAFAELYGLPLRIGRYGHEASPEDVEVLFRAVSMIGTDAAAVIPKSMEIDFQETKAQSGEKLFENLGRFIDEQVSKAVLGQTMTSDDGSSKAQAEVHNDVRHDILKSDARRVAGVLNAQLVKPYVDLNHGVRPRYPRLVLPVAEPEDTKLLMENVTAASGLGMRFSSAELYGRLGLRQPDKDEDTVGGAPAAPALARALRTAMARDAGPGEDPYAELDDIERAFMEEWRPQMDGLIDPIRDLIASADSYDQVVAGLPGLVGEMDQRALIDGLVQALFLARVDGGRA